MNSIEKNQNLNSVPKESIEERMIELILSQNEIFIFTNVKK